MQSLSYQPFRNLPPKSRILVAFSGGVDSATVAAMALQSGFEVIAVHMSLFSSFSSDSSRKAAEIAANLNIRFIEIDCSRVFEEKVLRPCWDSLCSGRTPNPCTICNPSVKFGQLMPLMEEYGCAAFATGHYAKIETDRHGHAALYRGTFREKDQSYFLFGLQPDWLDKIVFPLGAMTKSEVRTMAQNFGLDNANLKDSQDTCFVPPGQTAAEYLYQHFSCGQSEVTPGNFINETTGCVVGRHKGIYAYTIGQRKGTGVALGMPAWVSRIRAKDNTVWLSTNPSDLIRNSLCIHSVSWMCTPGSSEFRAQVQIRYRSKPANATVRLLKNGNVHILFDCPQRAVTPGQAAVIYDGDHLLGGGLIQQEQDLMTTE